jgi:hypothetical protein
VPGQPPRITYKPFTKANLDAAAAQQQKQQKSTVAAVVRPPAALGGQASNLHQKLQGADLPAVTQQQQQPATSVKVNIFLLFFSFFEDF